MRVGVRPVAASIGLMVLLSFIISYWLVPISLTTEHRQDSVLKLYHALLMASLMLLVAGLVRAIVSWRMMSRRARGFVVLSIVVGIAAIVGIRQGLIVPQVGMNTQQFARVMIEHHQNTMYMADMLLLRDDVPPPMQQLAANISKTHGEKIEFLLSFL